ncbi:hypothetical protein [Ruminococcus flavefaciens]|nr:hypothetical protein [Ruminococcus flavefaciens]MDD7517072.1 hypothetical protein [Ruminococcus flavefaciens]MDY5690944.1 hypothetical protein [Ruminococcus flavefaciens]
MSDKTFRRIIALITVIGTLSTAALVVYTCHLHNECSVISYVANGR